MPPTNLTLTPGCCCWCCGPCRSRPDSGGHRRHAHQAIRSEGRRGRHPPQPHAGTGRPKISLWTYLGDALAGRAASLLRCFGLAVAGHALRSPENDGHDSPVAGLDVRHHSCWPPGLVKWIAPLVKQAGKTLWIVVDGGYVKAPFLKRALRAGVTVIGRLHKTRRCATCRECRDAESGVGGAVREVRREQDQLGQARRIAMAGRRPSASSYGKTVTKLYKTFLATYRPTGGVIRVVIVEEDHDWYPFFSTDPNATAVEIIEAFADRATIEQDFHDVKEVWGAGQQQVRNIWTNLAVYHLNLWMHTLVELWSWNRPREKLCDRSLSPWDDAERRPSHADRRKALRRQIMEHELSTLAAACRLPRKILQLTNAL